MGCTGCSTGKDGASGGSSCSSGGCNKLNVYNWLSNMQLPHGQEPFNIVEIRFKGSRKEFFKNPDKLPLQVGDLVAVEGNPGHDIGTISMAGELVRFQLKKKGVKEDSPEIKVVYRKAKPNDVEKWEAAKTAEDVTMHRARSIAIQLKLSMKISDVEYQGDMKKATFYYTADERVDFRELIKRLAEEFKTRIEMRQIGMRQEASRLGGIGSCGRELCCSTWLTDFRSVSTSAARYQNLSLNPLKLAGQCGKLKCCLNYELDSYMDALKEFPDTTVVLQTEKGRAYHRKTDIFKRQLWYAYGNQNRDNADFADVPDANSWVQLTTTRAKEIIEMNKKKQFPADLSDRTFAPAAVKMLDFENPVGQDSLTRMDSKKPKPKHKKKKRPQGSAPSTEQINAIPAAGEKPAAQAPNPQANGPKPAENQQQAVPRPQGNNPRPANTPRPQGNNPNQQRTPPPPRQDSPKPQAPNPQNTPRPEGTPRPQGNRPPRNSPPPESGAEQK